MAYITRTSTPTTFWIKGKRKGSQKGTIFRVFQENGDNCRNLKQVIVTWFLRPAFVRQSVGKGWREEEVFEADQPVSGSLEGAITLTLPSGVS